uniref:2-oxoglutarate dehydrogenase, mitochondrial n=1 Tax=Lygus hesperus TaxID=30085 RepID=A0A146KSU1_LYGHE
MIKSFEDRGHLFATIDPLEFEDVDPIQRSPLRKLRSQLRLDLAYFGFTEEAAKRVVRVGFQDQVGGVLNTSSPPMTIGQLHELLKSQYCRNIGFELGYVADVNQTQFLRSQIEIADPNSSLHRSFSKEEKLRI